MINCRISNSRTSRICEASLEALTLDGALSFQGQQSGVISNGAQEVGAPLLKLLIILGAQPPEKFSALAFQSLLTLLPKDFLLL